MTSKLRFSMACGAVYDAVVGVSIACFLRSVSAIVPIPFPAEPFHARMIGVLLVGLAAFYWFAAHDLERNLRNVAGAILIRTAGGAYLVAYAAWGGIAPFYYVFGLADLAFALWHWLLLRSERGAAFLPLLLRGVER